MNITTSIFNIFILISLWHDKNVTILKYARTFKKYSLLLFLFTCTMRDYVYRNLESMYVVKIRELIERNR